MEAGRRGIYHNEGSYETKSRLQGEAYLGSNVRDQARAAVPQQSFEGAPPPPLPRHITNETASISLVSQKRSNNLESFWNFHGHQKQPFKVDRRSHHNANSSSSSDSVSDRDGIKQQRSNQKGRAARTADDEKQKKKKKEERTTCTTHLSTYLPSLGQHRMWVQVTNVGHSGIFLESFWKCPGDSRIFSGSAPVSQKNSFLEAHWCRSKKINFWTSPSSYRNGGTLPSQARIFPADFGVHHAHGTLPSCKPGNFVPLHRVFGRLVVRCLVGKTLPTIRTPKPLGMASMCSTVQKFCHHGR
eukprot:jgi/Bigna1/63127/fgenesh1_kg.47_\